MRRGSWILGGTVVLLVLACGPADGPQPASGGAGTSTAADMQRAIQAAGFERAVCEVSPEHALCVVRWGERYGELSLHLHVDEAAAKGRVDAPFAAVVRRAKRRVLEVDVRDPEAAQSVLDQLHLPAGPILEEADARDALAKAVQQPRCGLDDGRLACEFRLGRNEGELRIETPEPGAPAHSGVDDGVVYTDRAGMQLSIQVGDVRSANHLADALMPFLRDGW